jgi:hypothetical protein
MISTAAAIFRRLAFSPTNHPSNDNDHPSPCFATILLPARPYSRIMCALVELPGPHQRSRMSAATSTFSVQDAHFATAGPSVTKPASHFQASSSARLQCPLLFPESTAIHKMPRGVMSLSLGKDASHHNWVTKAKACRRAGHDGIEIHFEDLENTARVSSEPRDGWAIRV